MNSAFMSLGDTHGISSFQHDAFDFEGVPAQGRNQDALAGSTPAIRQLKRLLLVTNVHQRLLLFNFLRFH